jgi:hypothetical protein
VPTLNPNGRIVCATPAQAKKWHKAKVITIIKIVKCRCACKPLPPKPKCPPGTTLVWNGSVHKWICAVEGAG